MIKRVETTKRLDGPFSEFYTSYRAIRFEDDQSYYRAVTWMREHHGRAGNYRSKNPLWVHYPDKLTISLRWTRDAMDFLREQYNWSTLNLWVVGSINSSEIHEWCEQRGYLCEVRIGTTTICAPTDRDLLMARLRFSEYQIPEPVF